MWRFLWVSLPSELLLSCLNFRMNIQCFQGICWSVQKVRDSLFKVVGGDVLESKVKKLLGRTLLDSIDLCPGTWTHSDQLFHCVDSYESMEDFSGFPFFHGIYEGFADGGFISSWLEPTSSSHLQVIQGRLADVLKATGGTAWWRMDLYIPK